MSVLDNEKISTSLVGNTLGTTIRDVGKLCTHSEINKWSKWKPVRYNILEGIDLTQIESINYSLTTPTVIKDEFDESFCLEDWIYLRPEGKVKNGVDSPYRLGDFRNYFHQAPPPIPIIENPEVFNVVVSTEYKEIKASSLPVWTGNEASILLEDLSGIIGDYYFTAVLVWYDGQNKRIFLKSADKKFNDVGTTQEKTTIQIPKDSNAFKVTGADKYIDLYFILSSTKADNDGDAVAFNNWMVASNFKPVPTKNIYKYFKIPVINEFDDMLYLNIIGIGKDIGGPYYNISSFNSSNRFKTGPNAPGYFQLTVHNKTSENYTLNKSDFDIKPQALYPGGGNLQIYTNTLSMANSSGTVINSIVIPSKQTITFYIGADVFFREESNLLMGNELLETTVKINYRVSQDNWHWGKHSDMLYLSAAF